MDKSSLRRKSQEVSWASQSEREIFMFSCANFEDSLFFTSLYGNLRKLPGLKWIVGFNKGRIYSAILELEYASKLNSPFILLVSLANTALAAPSNKKPSSKYLNDKHPFPLIMSDQPMCIWKTLSKLKLCAHIRFPSGCTVVVNSAPLWYQLTT